MVTQVHQTTIRYARETCAYSIWEENTTATVQISHVHFLLMESSLPNSDSSMKPFGQPSGIFRNKMLTTVLRVLKVYPYCSAVTSHLKPGVSWLEMHKLAEETILRHLKAGGLLRGDVEAMMDARLGAIFMPHGLGHLMGCDVHDVGGYNKVGLTSSSI